MAKPHIQEPCSASWEKMKPVAGGRFCKKCCKVVMDFTNHTADQIMEAIRVSQEPLCARVSNSEVTKRNGTLVKTLSFRFSRFLAAVFLVFGTALFTTSCGGGMEMSRDDSMRKTDSASSAAAMHQTDSLKNDSSAKKDSSDKN